MKKDTVETKNDDFYIVGVGGSAGALGAFKSFLQNISDSPNIAIVIIQHLSRGSESYLSELLSSATHLSVAQVKESVAIAPGHIYIIPPDHALLVNGNMLVLKPRSKSSINFSIDTFFSSLANSKKQNAIGVLFSGAGTDGTLGLKAIKEAGGITFAQDDSAEFKSMPESAVKAGVVDYVLSPPQIAKRLSAFGSQSGPRQFASNKEQGEIKISASEEKDFRTILDIVRHSSDVDFTYYKPGTIQRRITRRMLMNDIKTYTDYVAYLKNNPKEAENLYRDILIHVTDFFRDPETFDFLVSNVLPKMLKEKLSLRVWVPGCSTGEEAYTFAIAFAELFESSGIKIPVQIFGTDLSDISLQTARQGIYPTTIADSVPPALLKKYFSEYNGEYMVNKNIRAMCIFAKHNMIADIPFSKMDIISCRNVLIYLDSVLQKKAFPIFHYGLNPDGLLILGTAETAGSFQDLFKQIDVKHRIYAKKSTAHRQIIEFPHLHTHGKLTPMSVPPANTTQSYSSIEKESGLLFHKKKADAGIVINEDLTIIHFCGDAKEYLAPSSGRATLDLLRMMHRNFLPKVLELYTEVKKGTDAVKKTYSSLKTEIEIVPLTKGSSEEKYFVIFFKKNGDKNAPKKTGKSKAADMSEEYALQSELSSTIEQLQAVIESRDASNEELRSAHEELMSSNEELQSTNEELETTKEELQSTNEELTTLNTELEGRNVELLRHSKELYRKDEFLSFLGHELRNPLSPIVHALELIQLHGIQDEKIKEMFDIIDRQTRVLNGIIKNLLDAARAMSGKIDLELELVDFDQTLKHSIETVQPIMQTNSHTLEMHTLNHSLSMLMDPGRIEQVIVNILTNAAKYTKPGGHITVTASEEGGKLRLSVKDNGIGIAPEILPNIFSLFYQGDQSLSNFKGGLGVGLVLSSTLAKLHSGNLIAKSDGVGKGSEFILELPIRRSGGRQNTNVDITNLKLEKRKIMVIDDNIELAKVFARLLRELNQDVNVVYDSTNALDEARATIPEIIFMDIAMPSLSDYELIEMMRREPALKQTRFIALSGFGKEYDLKSLQAGFDEYVIKPVSPGELQRILSRTHNS